MMSADPTVPEPMNGQAWNRYSYVINNPLAFTDPSGYSWLSEAFHGIQRLFRAFPIIGSIIRIAASAICSVTPGCQVFLVAVLTSAAVAGITTGKLGAALQAGLVAGLTAVAFNAVGDITGHTPSFLTPNHIANVAGHALVGCASSAASGGKCGAGALSAGITSFAGPVINNRSDPIGSLVRNTVLGGVASVAAGDKFANGAITAAFGYLFNADGGRGIGDNGGPPMEEQGTIRIPVPSAFVFLFGLQRLFWSAEFWQDLAAFADLQKFRTELELPPGEGTVARLDAGGQSFYGINGHGQPTDLYVNAQTRTHAEGDAFQQAKNAGVYGGDATLYVDRPLCAACGLYGGVGSMVRELGFGSLRVVTPTGTQYIRP